MKGQIKIKEGELLVEYLNSFRITRTIPVFKPDREFIEDEQVDFEIVDEFTHPQLFRDVSLFNGPPSARIIKGDAND
jgi:hypothetical protein